jgi:tRNA G18 (ribose-2'-O)-methylase SpoU
MTERKPHRIESDDNRVFKQLRRTLSGRGIRKYGSVLVSGAKNVEDVLRASPSLCEAWVSKAGHADPPEGLPEGAVWYQLPARLFRTLDVAGTDSPLLLVQSPPMGKWRVEDGFEPGCTLLVPFQDPENVGAVIRSAVAFGVTNVVLLAESAHPLHPKSLRASSGAVFHASLFEGPSVAELPAGLPIVALSPEGTEVSGYEFPAAFGLLPGVEGPGLPAHLRRGALSIPTSPAVESLNSATAAAIALYLWRRSSGRRPSGGV